MIEPQVFGYIAGALTTLSFLPQAIKTLKTKETESISLMMYALFVTGVFFWFAYGVMLKDEAIIIANLVTFIFASPILFLKVRHQWRKRAANEKMTKIDNA